MEQTNVQKAQIKSNESVTISIPERQRTALPLASKLKVIDIVVYFQDKTGLHLCVEDGQHTDAGSIFEMVMEEMKLPAIAREVFSLWLVSDLLELQLKPNHVPFKLVCYWEEMLEKYTTVDEDDRERDEPVLVFQRNVFYPRVKEKLIHDSDILRLLYMEAKEMVIDGRYPMAAESYDYLAGLQALLRYRHYETNIHTPEFYRNSLAEYFPAHLAKPKKKFFILHDEKSPEYRIAKYHRLAHEQFGVLNSEDIEASVCHAYLKFCWKFPFYGSAFFRGQIEHPDKGGIRILSLHDDPVWIAVNTDGVFILDMDDVKFLFGLTFDQLSWEYAEPRDKENPDCLPCLFLQFGMTEENKQVTKLMQVFSKEAQLADALIEACIKLKTQEKAISEVEVEEESKDNDFDDILRATGETWHNFNKLCLLTFDRSGQCISNPARVPKPN